LGIAPQSEPEFGASPAGGSLKGITSEQRTERHPVSRLRRVARYSEARGRIFECVKLGGTAKVFVPRDEG